MEITSTETETPAPAPVRAWVRRIVIGIACLPVAVLTVMHAMGRSGDFGALGRWYVMVPLTIACFLAWMFVEKTVERVVPTSSEEECPER